MIKIGITGSIASGKTTVAKMFSNQKYPLFIADKEVKKIYAVDVGKNKLHEKLKKEKKILNLPNTNGRYLDATVITDPIDLIVCDVSFISMKKVFNGKSL